MKTSPTAILATTILWTGTLIGAYQLGHRQQGADSSVSRTNTTTSGSRVAEGSHDESSGPAREHMRASEKTLSVKQLFMQLKAIMRPGMMQNPSSMLHAMALLDKLRPEEISDALNEF